jgi:hypothetical protein
MHETVLHVFQAVGFLSDEQNFFKRNLSPL